MSLKMLGAEIRDARKEEGLTQQQLADKVQTSKPVISAIENGHRNISYDVLEKIAGALNRVVADKILIKKQ